MRGSFSHVRIDGGALCKCLDDEKLIKEGTYPDSMETAMS